jgi:hypothetical protein
LVHATGGCLINTDEINAFCDFAGGLLLPRNTLVEAIEIWTEQWSDGPKRFVWHKGSQEIITTMRRGGASLADVQSTRH